MTVPNAGSGVLVEALTAFAVGAVASSELTEALAAADLFCVRGEEFGFQAVGFDGFGWVPMYSSRDALAATHGSSDWFSAPAVELLPLVPDGYGVVLDMGSPHEVRLPHWAIGTGHKPA